MKRATPERPVLAPGAIPPEIAIGPCEEVWRDDSREWPERLARVRWRAARAAWLAAAGISERDGWAVIGAAWDWSVAALDRQGKGERADERLARAGVTRDDLPALRRAAGLHLTDPSLRRAPQVTISTRTMSTAVVPTGGPVDPDPDGDEPDDDELDDEPDGLPAEVQPDLDPAGAPTVRRAREAPIRGEHR